MNNIFPTFKQFFKDIHGYEPYSWTQEVACHTITKGNLPEYLNAPTGMGKTSLIDIAVYALAHSLYHHSPRHRSKIIYAVERQTVVNGTTEHVANLVDKINNPHTQNLQVVHDSLKKLQGDYETDRPAMKLSSFHGTKRDTQAFRHLDGCEIISTTVTQVTLRAIGRSPHVSGKVAPMHAAQVVMDGQIIIDEPHLTLNQVDTLSQIIKQQKVSLGDVKPSTLTMMGATLNSEADEDATCYTFDVDKEQGNRASMLYHLPKPVFPVKVDKTTNSSVEIAKSLISNDNVESLAIILNSVDDVQSVYKKILPLVNKSHSFHTVYAITGQTRACERPSAKDLNQPGIVVVATQTVEAGVDFSASHMITELSPLSSFWQRIGRLNRYGDYDHPECYLLLAQGKEDHWGSDATQDIYGNACIDPVGEFFADEETFFSQDNTHSIDPSLLIIPTMDLDKDGIDFSSYGLDCGLSHQGEVEDLLCAKQNVDKKTLLPSSPQSIYVDEEVVQNFMATSANRCGDVDGFLQGLESKDEDRYVSVAWRSVLSDDMTLVPGETVDISVSSAQKLVEKVKKSYPDLDVVAKVLSGSKWKTVQRKRDITPGSVVVFDSVCGGYSLSGVNASLVGSKNCTVDDISLHLALSMENGLKNIFVPVSYNNLSYALKKKGVDKAQCDSTWNHVQHIVEDINSQVVEKPIGLKDISRIMLQVGLSITPRINDQGSVEFSHKEDIHSVEIHSTQPLSLDTHLSHTGDVAHSISHAVGLDDETTSMVSHAAYAHDAGKAHPLFQKMLGSLPGEVLAKSTGRIPLPVHGMDLPSHDFEGSEIAHNDLATWIIANHHGRARGVSMKNAQQSLSFIHLRKKLEQEYGVYGLAYLETIVRLADWTASALPDVDHPVHPQAQEAIDSYVDLLDNEENNDVEEDSIEESLPGLSAGYIPAWYATYAILCKGVEMGEVNAVRWDNTIPVFSTARGEESIHAVVSAVCVEISQDYEYAYDYIREKTGMKDSINTRGQKFDYYNPSVFIEMYKHLKEQGNIFASLISPWISNGSKKKNSEQKARIFISPLLASNSNVFYEPQCLETYRECDGDTSHLLWNEYIDTVVSTLYIPSQGWKEDHPVYSLNLNGTVTDVQPYLNPLAVYASLTSSIVIRGLGSTHDNDRLLSIPEYKVDDSQLWQLTTTGQSSRFIFGENNGEKAQKILPGRVMTH